MQRETLASYVLLVIVMTLVTGADGTEVAMPLGYFAMGGSLKVEDEEGEKAEKVIPSHHLAEIIRDTVKKAQTCERCLRLGLPCNSWRWRSTSATPAEATRQP
jgi:hypothetical protein